MTGPFAATVGAWSWHPHLLLWAVLAGVSAAAAIGHRRLLRASSHPQPWPRSRILRFGGAVVLAGATMGWPLGDLAAHWSLSALVLQRCLLDPVGNGYQFPIHLAVFRIRHVPMGCPAESRLRQIDSCWIASAGVFSALGRRNCMD